MSAPAAKAFSEPVMTMQPMAGSASNSSTPATISRIACQFSAFSACGRLSVMSATRPSVSVRIVS